MASDIVVNIGWGDGLSPVRRKAITGKHADFTALVQERCNSIANALELHLSCTNPLIYGLLDPKDHPTHMNIIWYIEENEIWKCHLWNTAHNGKTTEVVQLSHIEITTDTPHSWHIRVSCIY